MTDFVVSSSIKLLMVLMGEERGFILCMYGLWYLLIINKKIKVSRQPETHDSIFF